MKIQVWNDGSGTVKVERDDLSGDIVLRQDADLIAIDERLLEQFIRKLRKFARAEGLYPKKKAHSGVQEAVQAVLAGAPTFEHEGVKVEVFGDGSILFTQKGQNQSVATRDNPGDPWALVSKLSAAIVGGSE